MDGWAVGWIKRWVGGLLSMCLYGGEWIDTHVIHVKLCLANSVKPVYNVITIIVQSCTAYKLSVAIPQMYIRNKVPFFLSKKPALVKYDK